MVWITKPTALSAEGNLSDYTHITSFYEQMSNGKYDVSLSEVKCKQIVAEQLATTGLRFHFMPIILPRGGYLNEFYVNVTMKNNGYSAENYPGAFLIVYSADSTFPPQLVQSIQFSKSGGWKWILISNEGTQWTYGV